MRPNSEVLVILLSTFSDLLLFVFHLKTIWLYKGPPAPFLVFPLLFTVPYLEVSVILWVWFTLYCKESHTLCLGDCKTFFLHFWKFESFNKKNWSLYQDVLKCVSNISAIWWPLLIRDSSFFSAQRNFVYYLCPHHIPFYPFCTTYPFWYALEFLTVSLKILVFRRLSF